MPTPNYLLIFPLPAYDVPVPQHLLTPIHSPQLPGSLAHGLYLSPLKILVYLDKTKSVFSEVPLTPCSVLMREPSSLLVHRMPTLIPHGHSPKSVHGLLNSIELIIGRGLESGLLIWSQLMVNSKLGPF